MPAISIHTDGACSGNPGPGGWAFVINWDGELIEEAGGEVSTTNNRMELMATIKPLEAMPCPCKITIYTDSQYVVRAFKDGWISNWKRNGWRTANHQPVKNQDLWERLYAVTLPHNISWVWIKGHNGNTLNERCDELAREAIPR